MTSHALKADLVVRLPVRPLDRRNRRRMDRLGTQDQGESTPLSRLLGIAVVGWFGVMIVVTVLAV